MSGVFSPEILSALAASVSTIAGGSQAWVWYDKKRRDKVIDELISDLKKISEKQIEHSNTFITEEQTRKLLQEYFVKLEQAQAETSRDVKDIHTAVINLTIQIEKANAIADYKKELGKMRD